MPACAKSVAISAMFAVLLCASGCAKSALQQPVAVGMGGASGLPAIASAGVPASAAGVPATAAADGGAVKTLPPTDAGISLPPTGGAPGSGPGTLLTDVSTRGHDTCEGVSAADVIAALLRADPQFADIPSTREPGIGGDSSFIFSYLRADGSFALVVKRGDGDCVAGCVSNEYGYFATDATCTPQEVGHYSRVFAGASNLNCYVIEGTALWGVPSAAEPADVCVEEEDGGLARVDRVCEQRFADFSMRLSKIKAANRSCTSDDDCVVVDNAPHCSYSCGDITNRAGAEQVAALVAAADSTVCNADGVTCASTGIVPPCAPIRAGCVGNVCQGQ